MADAFSFVLHGHIPYARSAGRWPHGEEWLHEAIVGAYLPLLIGLHDLRDGGVPFQLTIGLTPVLLEQLGDAEIKDRFDEYCADQQRRAEEDIRRFADLGDYAFETLAARYAEHYGGLLQAYRRRFSRDLVGAFADLQRTGHLEILTSAATHGYLPLLRRPAAIRAQIETGIASSRRLLGADPSGMWLPECAYAPGVERYLEEAGITHFFVDAAILGEGGTAPAARAFRLAGEAALRFGWASGPADPDAPEPVADVLRPYLVGSSRVAVVARHPRVSGQVWSAKHGYPGDADYREFHRKDDVSGLRYWRVTDPEGDLGTKTVYDWDAARGRVAAHAQHFADLVRAELATHRRVTGRDGLLVAAFDLELFGHWWFEGVEWLVQTLRRLADAAPPASSSVAAWLVGAPPRSSVELREGSWGKGNDHSTWLNERTAPMWDELEGATRVLEDLVSTVAPRSPASERAIAQAARELLLAQSSDWEFLITTEQADEYARDRFRLHLLRFARCVEIAKSPGEAQAERELATLEQLDNPFPDVTWSAYAARQPALARS